MLEQEGKRHDGHPCFIYTRKRLDEVDLEQKLYYKLMGDSLDRSKKHHIGRQKISSIDIVEAQRNKKEGGFSKAFKSALLATLIIALLIGGGILIPVIAITTQSPIIVVLGILGLFFLIFLLLALAR